VVLTVPSPGLLTPGGFKPVRPAGLALLCDEKRERDIAFQQIGKFLDGIDIAYNDILVAKYIPEKIGTLLASPETQREQRWQNKVGMVLKYGPTAKQDGFKYEVGDWVFYRSQDGCEIGVKNEDAPKPFTIALLLSPAHIIGKLANPDLLW
jgi:hypothetical protein